MSRECLLDGKSNEEFNEGHFDGKIKIKNNQSRLKIQFLDPEFSLVKITFKSWIQSVFR